MPLLLVSLGAALVVYPREPARTIADRARLGETEISAKGTCAQTTRVHEKKAR